MKRTRDLEYRKLVRSVRQDFIALRSRLAMREWVFSHEFAQAIVSYLPWRLFQVLKRPSLEKWTRCHWRMQHATEDSRAEFAWTQVNLLEPNFDEVLMKERNWSLNRQRSECPRLVYFISFVTRTPLPAFLDFDTSIVRFQDGFSKRVLRYENICDTKLCIWKSKTTKWSLDFPILAYSSLITHCGAMSWFLDAFQNSTLQWSIISSNIRSNPR